MVDRLIYDRNSHNSLFDLVVVHKSLTTKVKVTLERDFVLSKVENIIETDIRVSDKFLLSKIEEQRPDIPR